MQLYCFSDRWMFLSITNIYNFQLFLIKNDDQTSSDVITIHIWTYTFQRNFQNFKIITYPRLHSLSCNRFWYHEYWVCWSSLPTEWQYIFHLQKWHIVLRHSPDHILTRPQHYWRKLQRRKKNKDIADLLVYEKLYFL